MASWFDSVAQSLGNFVTGHGFEDNSQRAIIDAQNEEKKKREQEQQQQLVQAPIVQQRTNTQSDASQFNAPSFTATIHPATQPIVQQPTQPTTPPQQNNPLLPKPAPATTITGAPVLPSATLQRVATAPHVVTQPAKPNVFQQIGNGIGNFFGGIAHNVGNFAHDTVKNTEGMVHDYATDPNNVPRNVIDYVFGVNNPLDGATLDYQHKDAQGRPTLVPRGDPTNFNDAMNRSLGGTLIQKVLIDPTLQGLGGVADVAIQGGGLLDDIGRSNDQIVKNSEQTQKIRDWLHGLKDTSGNNIAGTSGADQSAANIGTGHASLGDVGNVAMTGLNTGLAATILDPANLINPIRSLRDILSSSTREGADIAANDAAQTAERTLVPPENATAAPEVTPTLEPTPEAPVISATPSEPQLLLPEKSTAPQTPNGTLASNGPNGFITKTPTQIADTEAAINGIKSIDRKLNVIRQGKTNDIAVPQVRALMQKRNDLMSVATGDKTMAEINAPDSTTLNPADAAPGTVTSDATQPAATTDLGNPGAVPTDGTVGAAPTRDQLESIVNDTVNPTNPHAPAQKLTPQSELGDITQKNNLADNMTGELGVNEHGQIYQKVSQEQAHDTAVKNLLDGQTPEEYLANAQKTGEADSAELAILMAKTPKDSPVWAELASLKGKLGTQKGQALALLERTMRETATPAELTSRTLQKANTAGFDTTKIASEIENVNKAFTDARDAYNKVIQTPGVTNDEIQAAKDAFYQASKQSFTDEGKILESAAKNKEQKNLAYQLQKKSDVYLQNIGTSSLTSSPISVVRNFAQGVGSLAHQAGLAPRVEAAINRRFSGDKIGSFDTTGAKAGFKNGMSNLKTEFGVRAKQLGITKNPMSWVKHPVGTLRQLTTTGTELGNIPMEGAIRGGMGSEYRQILESQGFKGDELKNLTERNTITDPLNLRSKYAKEINDLNGLSNEFDRTGGTFRGIMRAGFTKLGFTDKTSEQLADFVDRDIFGFFKPTLIVGKKTADFATGGVAHLAPAIVKLSRGDKAGFVNEIAKTISTAGVTLPVIGFTGYALAKAGLLKQNEYGEWEIDGVPISGYMGAFSGPLAMGGIAGQNQHEGRPALDGYVSKAYQTIMNASPYGSVGDKLSSSGEVVKGTVEGVSNPQDAYKYKESMAELLGSLAKENIPASSFLGALNKMLGGNVKDATVDNPKNATTGEAALTGTQEAANQVISGIPGLSNLLPDKKNSFGDTIKKPDPVRAFLGASNPSIAQSDASTGITPVGSKSLNNVAKANLTTADDKATYNKAVQEIKDNGGSATDTEVFKQLTKSGNYLLASKYDSNIDKSISDTDKTTLVKYDAMDSAHQKVYVEDQKNALDTYTAQLNNKQAKGTLSQDDTKTYKEWSGTGNSLLVKALVAKTNVENNVDQETRDLYEQVSSKKEYNSLSAEKRAALDKYSQELAANGVTVKSFMNGGGGSGGGSTKRMSTAGIGTKAVTSGGGAAGKFTHQDINVNIPQVVKPAPQYVIKERKISVG